MFERVRTVMAILRYTDLLTGVVRGVRSTTRSIFTSNMESDALHDALQVLHLYGFALVHYGQKESVSANGAMAGGAAIPWQVKLCAACNAATGQSAGLARHLFDALADNLFDLDMTGAAGPYVVRAMNEGRCKVAGGEYAPGERSAASPAPALFRGLHPTALRDVLERLGFHGFAVVYYAGNSLEAAYGSSAEGKPWQTSLSAVCDKIAGSSGAMARSLFDALRENLFDLDRTSLAGTLVAWKISEGACKVSRPEYSHGHDRGSHLYCQSQG